MTGLCLPIPGQEPADGLFGGLVAVNRAGHERFRGNPACQCAVVFSEAVAEPLREVLESQDIVQLCSHELSLPASPGAEPPAERPAAAQ